MNTKKYVRRRNRNSGLYRQSAFRLTDDVMQKLTILASNNYVHNKSAAISDSIEKSYALSGYAEIETVGLDVLRKDFQDIVTILKNKLDSRISPDNISDLVGIREYKPVVDAIYSRVNEIYTALESVSQYVNLKLDKPNLDSSQIVTH